MAAVFLKRSICLVQYTGYKLFFQSRSSDFCFIEKNILMNMNSSSGPAMFESKCNFADVIGIVFNNWTALKLSVEHGMAGPPAAVARKLCSMVEGVSHILESGKAEWNDISDYLIDTMDSDFSTILEDESSVEVALHICKLHQLYFSGNFLELTSNVMLLPQQTPIHATFPMQRLQPQACDIGEEKEQALEPVEDDGWTVVKKK